MASYTPTMSDPAHREHAKQFFSLVDDVSRREGLHGYEVYERWLHFSAIANAQHVRRKDSAKWQEDEAEYMKGVGRFRKPQETMRDMASMLGVLEHAMMVCPKDFLSPVHMEIAANKYTGQFFTPYELSLATARMLLGDAKGLLDRVRSEGGTHITLQEPACGCGSMALAANSIMQEQGLNLATDVHWVMIDTDIKSVRGSYLQMNITGCSADIVHGNTLSLEEWGGYRTWWAFYYPKSRARTPTAPAQMPLRYRPPRLQAAE